MTLPSPLGRFQKPACALMLVVGLSTLSGCAVVSATAGAAISVTGAVVSTGIRVTGAVVEAGIDAATDD
ncbi:hypothetical protein [Limnobacter sp.]|uniref:hypothetical protein n=1 Tax=Limnobacter sp. TaxID=2003368 RepID=UPI0035112700